MQAMISVKGCKDERGQSEGLAHGTASGHGAATEDNCK